MPLKLNWGWLRNNYFYNQTPVVGFSFIVASKSRIEVLFWYLLIFTFMGFTIYNLENLVTRYKGKPTSTSVRPASSSSHINLTNITLNLQLSVFDFMDTTPFSMFDPVSPDQNGLGWLVETGATEAYCYEATYNLYMEHEILENAHSQIYFEMKKLTEYLLNYSQGYDLGIYSQKQSWQVAEWHDHEDLLREHREKLKSVLQQNWEPDIKTLTQGQKLELKRDFGDAFAGPLALKSFSLKTVAKLQLLNMVQNGELFSLNLFRDIMKWVIVENIEEWWEDLEAQIDAIYKGIEDMMNWTPDRILQILKVKVGALYSSIMDDLNELLSIKVTIDDQPSNTTYHLIETTTSMYGGGSTALMLDDESKMVQVFQQLLKYLIVLGPATNKLELEISTLPYLWLSYAFEAMQMCYKKSSDDSISRTEVWDWTNFRNRLMLMYGEDLRLDLETNMASGLANLQPFRHYIVTVKPTAVFYSLTESCYGNSHQYCLSQCTNNATNEQCGCFSWSQRHLNIASSLPMCSSPCEISSEEQKLCTTDCDAKVQHSCHLGNHQLEYVSYPIFDEYMDIHQSYNHQPMFLVSFVKVDSLNHPMFVESYQLTFGQFMGELGGVLELWLGINVICVAHLLVYLFKQLVLHHRALKPEGGEECPCAEKRKAILEGTLKLLEKKISRNSQLILHSGKAHSKKAKEMVLQLRMQDVKNRSEASEAELTTFTDTRKQNSKWTRWLRWNIFFKETPVVGFSFIVASRSRIEVVFWYLLILTFMGFTIYNVENLVSRYKGRPTSTSVHPTASTSHVNLTNMTLSLNLSLFDFFGKTQIPLFDIVDPNDHRDGYLLNKGTPTKGYCHIAMDLLDSPVDWDIARKLEIYEEMKKIVEYLMDYSSEYDLDIPPHKQLQPVAEWYYDQSLLREHRDSLKSLLQQYEVSTRVSSLTDAQRRKIAQEFEDAFNGPLAMKSFSLKTIVKLQLLEMVQRKELLSLHIFPDIMKLILDERDGNWKDAYEADVESIKHMKKMDAMKSRTAEESLQSFNVRVSSLYSSAMNDLNELLSIAIFIDGHRSSSKYHLVDTSTYISGGRAAAYLEGAMVQNFKQHLKYLVVLPPGTQRMKIEISTLPYLWLSYTLDVLNLCYSSYDTWKSTYLLEIRNKLMSIYEDGLSVEVETNMGNGLHELQPFTHYHVTVQPTAAFYSQTESCYVNSYQYCFSECLNKATEEECGCFSWSQKHLNTESSLPMCSGPCRITSKNQSTCVTDCDAKVQHSCHLATYQLEYVSHTISDAYLDLTQSYRHEPLYILSFEMVESLNHPVFMERYELTFSQFMAELGGVLELWLGINVIGIIHLLVYIVKKFIIRYKSLIPVISLGITI